MKGRKNNGLKSAGHGGSRVENMGLAYDSFSFPSLFLQMLIHKIDDGIVIRAVYQMKWLRKTKNVLHFWRVVSVNRGPKVYNSN